MKTQTATTPQPYSTLLARTASHDDPATKATLSATGFGALQDLVRPVDAEFATVYLGPTGPAGPDGWDAAARWHAIASHLAAEGTTGADIDAVGRHLVLCEGEPVEEVIIVRDAQVVLAQVLSGATAADIAHHGAPPPLGPLLMYWQRHPAYLLAKLTRDRVAITTVRGRTAETTAFSNTVDAVADEVLAAIAVSGADLLLLDGADDAHHVAEQVKRADRRITVHRITAATADERKAAIQHALDTYSAAVTARILMTVDACALPGCSTVQGVYATLTALSLGRVATLLVFDDWKDQRAAWFGPGNLCAVMPDLVQPDRTRRRGRLADVAIRAALLTNAQVRMLNRGEAKWLRGAIGAICR